MDAKRQILKDIGRKRQEKISAPVFFSESNYFGYNHIGLFDDNDIGLAKDIFVFINNISYK